MSLGSRIPGSVITSYSIHYTKLYDPGVGERDLADVGVDGVLPAAVRALELDLDARAPFPGPVDDIVALHLGRITSYNVCYTKLLRIRGSDASAQGANLQEAGAIYGNLHRGPPRIRNNFV